MWCCLKGRRLHLSASWSMTTSAQLQAPFNKSCSGWCDNYKWVFWWVDGASDRIVIKSFAFSQPSIYSVGKSVNLSDKYDLKQSVKFGEKKRCIPESRTSSTLYSMVVIVSWFGPILLHLDQDSLSSYWINGSFVWLWSLHLLLMKICWCFQIRFVQKCRTFPNFIHRCRSDSALRCSHLLTAALAANRDALGVSANKILGNKGLKTLTELASCGSNWVQLSGGITEYPNPNLSSLCVCVCLWAV